VAHLQAQVDALVAAEQMAAEAAAQLEEAAAALEVIVAMWCSCLHYCHCLG
jgi:hypothetical protein